MKKTWILLLCAILVLSSLAGCGSPSPSEPAAEEDETVLTAVVTIFPLYDWLTSLLGDRAEAWDVTLLTDSGVDMHSFQPSAGDIAAIASCDLFLYVGGESDGWVGDALSQTETPDRAVLDLLEILGSAAVNEELTEGMEAGDEEEEEAPSLDEHVWLSLKNARLFCASITEALISLDPAGEETYTANLASYDEALSRLDETYRDMVEAAPLDTLLFGDRFPFRYLTDDYDLNYYAAFPGCSADTEASFETIAFLSEKLTELGLPAVLTLDGSDGRIAATIAENAGGTAQVLTLDSMQSVSLDQAADTTYLSVMEGNLAVLTTALNP